jgi:hypothetical protein
LNHALLPDLGTKMDYHVRKIGLEGKGRDTIYGILYYEYG